MPPQKIFFLSVMNGAAWGGSEELWYQTALYCATKGFEVGVCCFEWQEKKNKLKKLEETGCILYLLPGKEETKKQGLFSSSRLNRNISSIPLEDFDIVIVNQGGWKDVAYSPFSKLYSRLKKYVLLFHNYNHYEKLSSTRKNTLRQWLDHAHKNLGATLKIFEGLEKIYGISVPRQQKLFNPLTISMPGIMEKYPPLKNGYYQFSVLAALDIERKAQDVLIRAFADPAWKERKVQLHFYGEGKDKAALEKLLKEMNAEKNIFIHGNAPDYVSALRNSHVVLQITHIDAMPITVLEAMAMAKPLVVSNVGDMPLWITEKRNGWICPHVTKATILQTLEKLWEARDKWAQMGMQSFLKFKEDFPAKPVEYFLEQTGIITSR